MNNKSLVCNLCGYSRTIGENEMFFRNESCPMCQSGILEYTEFKKIEEQINNKMAEQVKLLGNNRAWAIIESFKKAETRLAYRKIFLKTGGIIPETVIWVKEISGKEYLKVLI